MNPIVSRGNKQPKRWCPAEDTTVSPPTNCKSADTQRCELAQRVRKRVLENDIPFPPKHPGLHPPEEIMSHFDNAKILVPYDFSEFSLPAVETAMKIAGKNDNITVLHVVEPVPLYGYSADNGIGLGGSAGWGMPDVGLAAEIDTDHQQRVLEMLQAEFNDVSHQGLNYETVVNEPAHGITDYAEQNGFDLIVLPSHGRTGVTRLLIGSTAERVVRLAHCPVLVLRA
ncbi:universal stress protein [Novipirellula sp. SH528]|uniref:universal stress protein n=1 Tax=Novipirellula sp. SH528 TaxID=3454466 RepID=UPI003FA133D9